MADSGPPPKEEATLPPSLANVTRSKTTSKQYITLTYHKGDIFDAPDNAVLIQACNCQGNWGAGIALAFKDRYPIAYNKYHSYCVNEYDGEANLVPTGTCFLIPPCESDESKSKHWIACLFTSKHYGRRKERPMQILVNTKAAIQDLLQQIADAEKRGGEITEIRSCRINSAKFAVPWSRTAAIMEEMEVQQDWRGTIHVWDR